MSTFADVAAFAQRHAACGGLVPRVHSPRNGGYMLTVTCACGAVHERWVTADEARQLPRQDVEPPVPGRPPSEPTYELLPRLDPHLAEPAPEAGPPPVPKPVTRPLRPQPVTARPATIFRPPERPQATVWVSRTDAAAKAGPTTPATTSDTHVSKPQRWLAKLRRWLVASR